MSEKLISSSRDHNRKQERYLLVGHSILIFCWLSFLADSDSYMMPYLCVGMLGSFSLYSNWRNNIRFVKSRENITAALLSALFSVMVLMANYTMLTDERFSGYQGRMIRLLYIVVLFVGGYFTVYHLLTYLARKADGYVLGGHILTSDEICHDVPVAFVREPGCLASFSDRQYKLRPGIVFFGTMMVLSVIDLIFLFLADYPGNLTWDSLSQISQILSGVYSNHHPFYHTMVIKLFLTIGMQLFGGINEAVALYHVFQILFITACFSYVVLTMYQVGISIRLVILALVWYGVMPFHIMYSYTMWKDVMFGGGVVLFVVAVWRISKKVGRYQFTDYFVMVVGGIGTCLFRSNGWFVFAISTVCFAILFWKSRKRLLFSFIGILLVTFVMKHAVLSGLGVSQPDIVEALSIPLQQVARVIADDGKLTENQLGMLKKLVDIEEVGEKYARGISDPVKNLVKAKGNQDYLKRNAVGYLKLYIEIGLANPEEYIKAWIDETKGYWNGGYEYWRWAKGIHENGWGIVKVTKSVLVNKALDKYLWLYSNVAPLQIFMCIGFYVWGIIILGYICMVKKNKEGVFSIVPSLAIVLSLLVSTPVYSEFRYAYAIFCCMPFLVFATFYDSSVKKGIL